jgi:hypothetical protein
MSYITLSGQWFDIVVLNTHVTAKNKSDDTKDSFYEELELVFSQFLIWKSLISGNQTV